MTVLVILVSGLYFLWSSFSKLEPPSWAPEVNVVVYDQDLMQPGWTVFGPNMNANKGEEEHPSYFAFDESGELVWYYEQPGDVITYGNKDLEVLPDGNYLIHIDKGFRVIEPDGKLVFEFDSIDLGLGEIHHDITFTPDRTFIAIASKVVELEAAWTQRPGVNKITTELLVEVDYTGDIVWVWDSLDHLDINRIALEQARGPLGGGTYDWLHANGMQYFEDDDSILLSLRSQSWVIKIDHATGEVVWRLGWGGDFELSNRNPADQAVWFSAQHAPELHSDGTILIYDNGNERAWTNELFSRAVIYQLDETTMTAHQTWQYETDYYTDFVGDVDLLENFSYWLLFI